MFKLFSHFKWKPNHVITTPEIPIISIYLSPFLVAGGPDWRSGDRTAQMSLVYTADTMWQICEICAYSNFRLNSEEMKTLH